MEQKESTYENQSVRCLLGDTEKSGIFHSKKSEWGGTDNKRCRDGKLDTEICTFSRNKKTLEENKEAEILQTVKGNSFTQCMINLQHCPPENVIGIECLAEFEEKKVILHANKNTKLSVIAEN